MVVAIVAIVAIMNTISWKKSHIRKKVEIPGSRTGPL